MGKINVGRVILGGLVAGVILSIGEFVLNEIVLKAQMTAFLSAHLFKQPAASFIVIAVLLTFALGIVMVLGYAAIRPRFGPGPKTAIIAALFAWFGIYVYAGTIYGLVFQIPMNTLLLGAGWGLVEYVIAAFAGTALYKEA